MPEEVTPKDLILALISETGTDGESYGRVSRRGHREDVDGGSHDDLQYVD
ncbi:3-isopropylmalate dehydratase large subunit [Cutibacterium acnes HL042PA3]|nr:3-isopropylmalate dehydratase large subunit [Cutibacterium acnes HL042PA3]MCW5113363.1 hypothetical protein [Cutibacterium acnes P05]GAE79983.1 3-isopropylmalate dehydratase [Cutibacterium acnes JCM 18920]